MENKSTYRPHVPSVDQASRVLISLATPWRPKMNLTEICREVGIHKSKGYSILRTLMGFGFVVKNPQTKTYTLGPGLVSLARHVLDNLDHRAVVSPFLVKLAKKTGSTALFGLISGSQVFILGKQEGDQNIGVTIGLGHRFHITSGAHGKAIVAFLPAHEREKILRRKSLYFYGTATPVDRNRLERDLEACRKRGFAQDTGDLQPGIHAVSAPVFGHLNRVTGCLILIGTFPRTKIGPYGDRVARTARRISTRLGAEVETIYRHAREGVF